MEYSAIQINKTSAGRKSQAFVSSLHLAANSINGGTGREKFKIRSGGEGKRRREEGPSVMAGLTCLFNLTSSDFFQPLYSSSTHLISVSSLTGREQTLVNAGVFSLPLKAPPLKRLRPTFRQTSGSIVLPTEHRAEVLRANAGYKNTHFQMLHHVASVC